MLRANWFIELIWKDTICFYTQLQYLINLSYITSLHSVNEWIGDFVVWLFIALVYILEKQWFFHFKEYKINVLGELSVFESFKRIKCQILEICHELLLTRRFFWLGCLYPTLKCYFESCPHLLWSSCLPNLGGQWKMTQVLGPCLHGGRPAGGPWCLCACSCFVLAVMSLNGLLITGNCMLNFALAFCFIISCWCLFDFGA